MADVTEPGDAGDPGPESECAVFRRRKRDISCLMPEPESLYRESGAGSSSGVVAAHSRWACGGVESGVRIAAELLDSRTKGKTSDELFGAVRAGLRPTRARRAAVLLCLRT